MGGLGGLNLMLKIRPEQHEAVRQAALKQFEDDMVVHLQKFSPKLSAVLKEPGLRTVVKYGMARAESHKLKTRGCTQLYIELILLFGAEFDTDPQYPWAGKILGDERIVDEMERGSTLHKK